MVQVRSRHRLKAKIRRLLIGGQLIGITQNEIIQKCRTYNKKSNLNGFTGDDIREVLKDWRIRGLAQRFKKASGHSKKPITIWRATEQIKGAVL